MWPMIEHMPSRYDLARKTRQKDGPGPTPPPKVNNSSVRCFTCKTAKRQRSMQIYDCFWDVFFCDNICEGLRPDRIDADLDK